MQRSLVANFLKRRREDGFKGNDIKGGCRGHAVCSAKIDGSRCHSGRGQGG
jgi:hypothetical protein